MRRTRSTDDDRGQAFTLEGFIGAIVVLTAVLFALQAVVITPTTGGTVDRGAQAQFEQEVKDTLLIAENEEELTNLTLNWDTSEGNWVENSNRTDAAYSSEDFANISDFGAVLDEHFVNQSGNSYNVELIAYDEDGTRYTEDIVRMGGGRSDGAVSASYTVTIYHDQNLTASDGDGGFEETDETVEDAWDDYGEEDDERYPLPPSKFDEDERHNTVYNVVEIRVTVW